MSEQRIKSNTELKKLIKEMTRDKIPEEALNIESNYMKINDNLQICINLFSANEFKKLSDLIEKFIEENK